MGRTENAWKFHYPGNHFWHITFLVSSLSSQCFFFPSYHTYKHTNDASFQPYKHTHTHNISFQPYKYTHTYDISFQSYKHTHKHDISIQSYKHTHMTFLSNHTNTHNISFQPYKHTHMTLFPAHFTNFLLISVIPVISFLSSSHLALIIGDSLP